MNAESNTPKTLQEAIKHFAEYSNAHVFMVQIRWPSGIVQTLKAVKADQILQVDEPVNSVAAH